VVLSGAASVAQLQSNLKALGAGWDAEAAAALSALAEPPEVYWEQRKRLEWN
jgi:aryl-alcohol dehydrogenase-like predicted oxidoreductase